MFTSAPTPTTEQLAKITKLQEQRKAALDRVEESWQRSDTDEFLSQWANDLEARRISRQIEVLKNGGCWTFDVLVHVATGEVIATKTYSFAVPNLPSYMNVVNVKWRVEDKFLPLTNGKKWIPEGHKSRIQKQLGLKQEARWFKARAVITGSGRGLSGNAWVTVEKVEAA